jgi:sugar phosphate isomerase/epimerase
MTATAQQRYRFTIAIIESSFYQTGKSERDIVRICRQSGFAGVEGWLPMLEGRSLRDLEAIEKMFREEGLVIDTFHLPHKDPVLDDMAALYEGDRRKVEESMKHCIDRAVVLGSTIGIVHPTTRKGYAVDVEGIDRLLGQLGKTLEALLRHGEQYGFRLAVENMLPSTGGRLGCEVEHLERIRARHDHPNLGFCLDTGHALVSAGERAMEILRVMKDRLIAFHLDDNAGDRDSHLAPGHGRFPWRELFDELAGMRFTNTICVEAPPFAYGPDYAVEAWKRMHEEVCALAEGKSIGG